MTLGVALWSVTRSLPVRLQPWKRRHLVPFRSWLGGHAGALPPRWQEAAHQLHGGHGDGEERRSCHDGRCVVDGHLSLSQTLARLPVGALLAHTHLCGARTGSIDAPGANVIIFFRRSLQFAVVCNCPVGPCRCACLEAWRQLSGHTLEPGAGMCLSCTTGVDTWGLALRRLYKYLHFSSATLVACQ